MDDGIFTLIFILLVVFMSVVDAIGRKRQKGRRMEEMEREEEAARKRRAQRGAGPAASRERPGPAEAEPEEAERETADQMVPDEFWAILTGQEPPTREEPPADTPPREPEIPAPVPDDRMSDGRTPGTPSPRKTRRSAAWMEGIEGREEPDRAQTPIAQDEEAAYGGLGDPWGELGDISEGDVTGRRPVPTGGPAVAGTGLARRRRRQSRYTEMLESGTREDLRKAVVLREVLGPPVAFRD